MNILRNLILIFSFACIISATILAYKFNKPIYKTYLVEYKTIDQLYDQEGNKYYVYYFYLENNKKMVDKNLYIKYKNGDYITYLEGYFNIYSKYIKLLSFIWFISICIYFYSLAKSIFC